MDDILFWMACLLLLDEPRFINRPRDGQRHNSTYENLAEAVGQLAVRIHSDYRGIDRAGELPAPLIFFSAALAIVPIAGLIVRGTENLATRIGDAVGDLLNATFGDAPELRTTPKREDRSRHWYWELC